MSATSLDAAGREATIRRLFPMVRAMARRLARIVRGCDLDDLAGDGSVGLVRAVDTFDPARGVSLEAYARRLILGAMLNGLRRVDPVSERIRRTLRHADAKRYALAQARGSLPALAEIERDDATLRRARTIAYNLTALSLDAPYAGRNPLLLDAGADPSRRYQTIDARRRLASAIDALPERQRRIVAMHYYGEVPLRRVGRELAISPQRASQLHLHAIALLRGSLGAAFASDLRELT